MTIPAAPSQAGAQGRAEIQRLSVALPGSSHPDLSLHAVGEISSLPTAHSQKVLPSIYPKCLLLQSCVPSEMTFQKLTSLSFRGWLRDKKTHKRH